MVATAWGYGAFICQGSRLCRFYLPVSDKELLLETLKAEYPLAKKKVNLQPGLQRRLLGYFEGRAVDISCTAEVSWASDFGFKVLRQCCRIRPGQTDIGAPLTGGGPNIAPSVTVEHW